MAKETFMLVSLNEKKAKKLAEVISNNTCRKILDLLAKKESTETEISKELDIPISTVHYNLKHLLEAKLVKADEYHYSEKGKEVLHYKLANQYVIIAPESSKSKIKEKLKSIIPAGLITLGLGALSQILYQMKFNAAEQKFLAAPEMARDAMILSEPVVESQVLVSDVNVFVWFLLGAFLFLASYIFIEYIRKKWQS
jgi:DNA-binding transcriptional ArsR family regulator